MRRYYIGICLVALMALIGGCISAPPPLSNSPVISASVGTDPETTRTGDPVAFCLSWSNSGGPGFVRVAYTLTENDVVIRRDLGTTGPVAPGATGSKCEPLPALENKVYVWSATIQWGPRVGQWEGDSNHELTLCRVPGQCIWTEPANL